MMNKLIITIAFAFLCIRSQSQNMFFDKGNGPYDCVKRGGEIMNLVQQNNMEELLKFAGDTMPVNRPALEKELAAISKKYPYTPGTHPMSFMTETEDGYYYERNFYLKKDGKYFPMLQIHVKLADENGEYFMTKLEFRRGAKIQKRNKEIARIIKVGKGAPPPPPAPF